MANEVYDVLIVGAGVSGFSAGMYCGRFGMKVAVVGELPGGMITTTHEVENYPGFVSISGQGLADNLQKHMEAYNVPLLMQKVESVAKKDGVFEVKTDSGMLYAKSIIGATGTEWKKLGAPGEKEFANKGVHYCALCDGNFYKGKTIAIVGSGDSAAKESVMLAGIAKKVYILVRGDRLKGEPITNRLVEKTANISVHTNVQVKEIIGDKKVNSLKLSRAISDEAGAPESDSLAVDAVFVQIGHAALTSWASGLQVALNKRGEFVTDKLMRTNVEGFFAAGDCTDGEFKQAIVSASEGVIASYAAHEYVSKMNA